MPSGPTAGQGTPAVQLEQNSCRVGYTACCGDSSAYCDVSYRPAALQATKLYCFNCTGLLEANIIGWCTASMQL